MMCLSDRRASAAAARPSLFIYFNALAALLIIIHMTPVDINQISVMMELDWIAQLMMTEYDKVQIGHCVPQIVAHSENKNESQYQCRGGDGGKWPEGRNR